MRTTRHVETASPPPARRADGEAALAGLLRIGSGLGAGARYRSWHSRGEAVLVGVLLGGALALLLLSLGAVG